MVSVNVAFGCVFGAGNETLPVNKLSPLRVTFAAPVAELTPIVRPPVGVAPAPMTPVTTTLPVPRRVNPFAPLVMEPSTVSVSASA